MQIQPDPNISKTGRDWAGNLEPSGNHFGASFQRPRQRPRNLRKDGGDARVLCGRILHDFTSTNWDTSQHEMLKQRVHVGTKWGLSRGFQAKNLFGLSKDVRHQEAGFPFHPLASQGPHKPSQPPSGSTGRSFVKLVVSFVTSPGAAVGRETSKIRLFLGSMWMQAALGDINDPPI